MNPFVEDAKKPTKGPEVSEEEIKKKKEIVKKMLSERYNKTKEELATLRIVQQELDKLEHTLDSDVVILRERIDAVERDIVYYESYYRKKEKEYKEAKAVFDKKLNEKKLLTDHLSLIIFENEKRKDEKLREMMSKLEPSKPPVEENGWGGFTEEELILTNEN
eukprot:TRINITY_DN3459_c0_g1_i2.p1 TRINITY_DN3459_c0_g1~~TRINITY_DN3459_c0_g1_i2.p1  ORF type:complete len:163 (-),score=46.30 TRINITY_DN3459_c0_g1_i2:148-636(-)